MGHGTLTQSVLTQPKTVVICFCVDFNIVCFVCAKDDAIMENNMKMEVTGKLKTHFNTAPKHSTTTAGVSVIMVSTWNET